MNTKYLMISSSVFLALIGVVCTFGPAEMISYIGLNDSDAFAVIVQILGALYLGFAILNWTAKGNLIGGIYSKPVSLGNFLHFVVGALSLAKYFSKHTPYTILLLPIILYVIFAVAFGLVSFGKHELKKQA